jgi:hypothetical protein
MSYSLRNYLAALVSLVAATQLAAQTGAGFQVTKKIPLGGAGSWDYTLVDAASHRLYQSHGNEAVVINLDTDSVIGRVTPANGIHGIAVANEFNRGFTSNGRDTSVTIFDLKTFATIAVVKVTGTNPDAIWYDDVSKRVFTMNAAGSSTVLDAAKGTVVATIPLGAKPEFAQTDGKGLIYITLETDPGQIVVVDTKTAKEVKRYPLPGCDSPSGLAIDRMNTRLFSACGGTRTITVSDPTAGKVITTIPMCNGTDAAAFDPELHLIFGSCSDGHMTVVRQDGPDKYTSLGDANTQNRSRTMGYDPRTHKAYLAAVESAPVDPNAPPPPAGGRARGPAAVPNSFMVIVLEIKK